MIKTEERMIGPEEAARMLETRRPNRVIRKSRVAVLARAIQAGHWILNGQAIIFNEKGELLDGQHRLTAIVETGIAVPLLVTCGVPDEAMSVIDTGLARSTTDVLHLSGYRNTHNLASFLSLVTDWEMHGGNWNLSHRPARPQEALLRLQSDPGLIEYFDEVASIMPKTVLAPGPTAFLYWLFSKYGNRAKALAFLQQLGAGEWLEKGDPIYALREKLIASREARRVGAPRQIIIALAIKAWNAHVTGRQVRILAIKGDEAFPLVHGEKKQ